MTMLDWKKRNSRGCGGWLVVCELSLLQAALITFPPAVYGKCRTPLADFRETSARAYLGKERAKREPEWLSRRPKCFKLQLSDRKGRSES